MNARRRVVAAGAPATAEPLPRARNAPQPPRPGQPGPGGTDRGPAPRAPAWAGCAGAHSPRGPAKPCPGATDAVLHKPAPWFVIKAPPGMSHIVTHAAGRSDGTWVLASDGSKVMRSEDSGCTWKPSFSVTTLDTGDAHALPEVASLSFPGAGQTALMVIGGVGGTAAPQLMRSDDGGATWQAAGNGLPTVGT